MATDNKGKTNFASTATPTLDQFKNDDGSTLEDSLLVFQSLLQKHGLLSVIVLSGPAIYNNSDTDFLVGGNVRKEDLPDVFAGLYASVADPAAKTTIEYSFNPKVTN